MFTMGTFLTICSPILKILRPKKLVTNIPRIYIRTRVRNIPNPGISSLNFVKTIYTQFSLRILYLELHENIKKYKKINNFKQLYVYTFF